jgi:hypothetical protein
MRYFKWGIIALVLTFLAGLAHYTLPQRDIVIILDAYEKRMDVSSNALFWAKPDSGTTQQDTRDVRFIDTEYPDGSVMVFRNEDTGWGWPFYFKFDSSDLSAKAKQLVSNAENPKWVAVRHYGWRNKIFSIFPNAVSMKQVPGPDVTLIPWFNINFLTVMSLLLLGLYRLLQRFKRRRIDPVLDDIGEAWDDVEGHASDAGGFVRRFINWLRRPFT